MFTDFPTLSDYQHTGSPRMNLSCLSLQSQIKKPIIFFYHSVCSKNICIQNVTDVVLGWFEGLSSLAHKTHKINLHH